MTPTATERDTIFKAFGRAFFKQDLDAMYQVVTPDFVWTVQGDMPRQLASREQILAYFAERKQQYDADRAPGDPQKRQDRAESLRPQISKKARQRREHHVGGSGTIPIFGG